MNGKHENTLLSCPRNAWAYMYDGKLPGIGAHADDSQVQINIYLTPSEAAFFSPRRLEILKPFENRISGQT